MFYIVYSIKFILFLYIYLKIITHCGRDLSSSGPTTRLHFPDTFAIRWNQWTESQSMKY